MIASFAFASAAGARVGMGREGLTAFLDHGPDGKDTECEATPVQIKQP